MHSMRQGCVTSYSSYSSISLSHNLAVSAFASPAHVATSLRLEPSLLLLLPTRPDALVCDRSNPLPAPFLDADGLAIATKLLSIFHPRAALSFMLMLS